MSELSDPILEDIASVLRRQCRIEPGVLMVVGVSGGPDSLCLLHVLHALGHDVLVAHLDHQLRPESAAEAVAVEATASALGLPFIAERVDVGAHARSEGLSVEEAARELRYEFLFGQARAHSAQAVAVAHTADDQIETVLMHLIRGGGMAGLRGMSYRSVLPHFDEAIPLVRPLLGTWRHETVEYCWANSLRPLHDRTNESLEFFRNRVRHELIPLLESYNPRVRAALWRTAETLGADLALVEERVAAAWKQAVLRQAEDFVCFDGTELARQPIPLQRRLILRAAERLRPALETGFAGLERAAVFIADASSSRLDLGGGLTLLRQADGIYVSVGERSLPRDDWPQINEDLVTIPVHESVTVSLAGDWRFTASYMPASDPSVRGVPGREDPFRACLDADSLPGQLELRPPRPGDRFRPLGLQGHSQKLSDFFVNAKLPARARARWPLLCSGQILVWVPGFRPAEDFRLRESSQRAACFAVSRPRKSGLSAAG